MTIDSCFIHVHLQDEDDYDLKLNNKSTPTSGGPKKINSKKDNLHAILIQRGMSVDLLTFSLKRQCLGIFNLNIILKLIYNLLPSTLLIILFI